MAVNDLTVNQAATILNAIMQQANIGGDLAVIDGSNFVSVGQTVLKAGYDVILNAISQVLTRTIFSMVLLYFSRVRMSIGKTHAAGLDFCLCI